MLIKVDRRSNNPLIEAYFNDDLIEFKNLIEKGHNINCICGHRGRSLISIVLADENKSCENKVEKDRNKKFFDLLIDSGVHLGIIGKEDCLLNIAITNHKESYYLETLLKQMNDVNYCNQRTIENSNFYKSLPIYDAVTSNNINHVKTLIRFSADLTIYGDLKTPFLNHLFSKFKEIPPDFLSFLIKNGADPNQKCKHRGKTSLHQICDRKFDEKLLNILFENNADIEISDFFGETPLMRAGDWADVETFDYFVKRGADLNKRNNNGETAAFNSITNINNGYKKLKILSDMDADFSIKNNSGYNIIHKIVDFIIKYGANVNNESIDVYFDILRKNKKLLLVKDELGNRPIDYMKRKYKNQTWDFSEFIKEDQKSIGYN